MSLILVDHLVGVRLLLLCPNHTSKNFNHISHTHMGIHNHIHAISLNPPYSRKSYGDTIVFFSENLFQKENKKIIS